MLRNVPSVQLASEGGVFGTAPRVYRRQVLGEDLFAKEVGANDHKGSAMRKPCNNIGEGRVRKNVHESLGENLSLLCRPEVRSHSCGSGIAER